MTSLALVVILSAVVLASATGSPLDSREVFPGIGQYFLNTESMDWTQAYLYCRSNRGHLAVINSVKEATVIKQMMAKYSLTDIHIGFHDMISEGSYVTIEGDLIDVETDTQWTVEAPKGGLGRNCGSLTQNGITDADCSVALPSFCELDLWDDYELIPDHGYYQYHSEKRTWVQAWEICQSEGTRLLIVNSLSEMMAIQGQWPVDGPVWVGIHRLFGAKEFVTVNNEPLASTGYSKWYLPYPSANATEYPSVGLYRTPGSDAGLGTFIEKSYYNFICERSLHP